jgi:hypothetical protein
VVCLFVPVLFMFVMFRLVLAQVLCFVVHCSHQWSISMLLKQLTQHL